MPKISLLLVTLALAACGPSQDATPPPAAGPPADPPAASSASVYAAAVANPARPAADRARDAGRKPAEVLEFFGVRPGMTVLDMFSGGGYYTELLAYVVGDSGHVIAHSNEAYLQFVGEEFENRYLGGRLDNVEVLMAENNELATEPASLDGVLLVLSFHDLYYEAPDRGWPKIDVDTFLAELKSGLKPGGFVGIVDHHAGDSVPFTSGNTVHRIDRAIVIEEMTAAGFVLDGESDLLRNPDDDYSRPVFDPELRGRTDRFVLRFRKPE